MDEAYAEGQAALWRKGLAVLGARAASEFASCARRRGHGDLHARKRRPVIADLDPRSSFRRAAAARSAGDR